MIGLRDNRALTLRLVTGFIVVLLSACGGGKYPHLAVQLCLENESGVSAFKQTLQSIALERGMLYADSSAEVMRQLEAVGATEQHMHSDGGLIYIGLERGLRLIATNVGLNPYDVIVSFHEYPNADAANEFSADVVAQLERNWTLKPIPRGAGAHPDPKCVPASEEASAPPNKRL